ncbi:MAG: hypothetical protein JOY60_10235 [Burkholderiaceae bacterium]|nr:hypothetical protein [Roseateles sp.]MBV8470218.1 hypothetical protein [Burkholderiaceae bacterium]
MSSPLRDKILEAGLSDEMSRLMRIARQLEAGSHLSPEDMEFAADALRNTVAKTTSRRGRPRMTGTQGEKWFEAVWRVETLRDKGMSREAAMATVCEERHVGEESLKKHTQRLRKLVRAAMNYIAGEEKRIAVQNARIKAYLDDLDERNARYRSLAGQGK